MRLRPVLLLALTLLTACPPLTDDGDDVGRPCGGACAEGMRCDEARDACVPDLPDRCTAGTAWTPGTAAFHEVGQIWGLADIEPTGVRLSVTDLDGDGWADLAIRKAGGARDALEGGARASWLLHNLGDRRFEDVTLSSGFVTPRGGGAVGRPVEIAVWADVDDDGDLDAFTALTADAGAETSEILLNDGTGHFTLGPEDSDLRKAPGFAGGASFTDFNRDGFVDLWVGYGGGIPAQDRLFVGLGDGEFVDVTKLYGLETQAWRDPAILDAGHGHTVAWGTDACDLNGDGVPELLAASYGRAPNHLFEGHLDAGGAVSYENRSVASGYAYDDRTDWTDNESARCWCHLHPTAPGCDGVPPPAYIVCTSDADAFRWDHAQDRDLWRLGGNSGTTVCADVDADGDLDLLTTEIVHWDVGSSSDPSELLFNTGETPLRFERPGNEATGLTRPHTVPWDDGDMTGAVFDFDNDGRPDVYVGSSDYPGTRGWLWHQRADGTFEAVPVAEGIDHESSHGIAVADFDRDGDLDVAVGHSRMRCSTGDHCYPDGRVRLFQNDLGQDGNWVQVDLVGGEGTNRAAIGARVTVRAAGVVQTQEVGGGHGHYGLQQDRVLHFGLGADCSAEVEVRWPDAEGTTETFVLPAGYRFRLVQGQSPAVAP